MASPGRVELPAPRLGGVCSVHLSYGDLSGCGAGVLRGRHPARLQNAGTYSRPHRILFHYTACGGRNQVEARINLRYDKNVPLGPLAGPKGTEYRPAV